MTSDAFWQLVMTILNHRFIKFHDQKQEPSESRAFLGLLGHCFCCARSRDRDPLEVIWAACENRKQFLYILCKSQSAIHCTSALWCKYYPLCPHQKSWSLLGPTVVFSLFAGPKCVLKRQAGLTKTSNLIRVFYINPKHNDCDKNKKKHLQ